MMQQFPIFVDLHVVPPLIIGDAPALAAKVRLLRKAARRVDVIASENSQWRSEFATARARPVKTVNTVKTVKTGGER